MARTSAPHDGRLPEPGLGTRPGRPAPLGATVVPTGVNFAVCAPGARALWLVLMAPESGDVVAELPFPEDGRTGDVFAVTVSGPGVEQLHYGYRVGTGAGTAAAPVLLDPRARGLAGGGAWGERPRYRSQIGEDTFDWGGTRRPRTAPEDLVVYELHVRGFTRDPSSQVARPGTYAGLREKIPYLLGLGVNCVELLPVFEFDETDNTYTSPETGAPLLNYWGYNPVGFFAPKAAYAATPTPDAAARELKELVRALHEAGIAVVLDVVFNHTAEGDHRGPTQSLRGLDGPASYLMTPDGGYRNLTATGNTVNANHPRTRALILDSLRHWATEYRVDGFRFDMACILARGQDGELLDNPPLLEDIAHDPVLADRLLVAEATDATGLDLTGGFPSYGRWSEWNARYRDDIRRFLLGRPGSAAAFAPRLLGSPDLYGGRTATASVNYITCHDGMTLADLTSYDERHNHANGEGGADGIPDEDSWNCGHEGPTGDPAVLLTRDRQRRTALALLFLSQGVPMLLAGDEFGRTQQGNNNAYSQDNPISWLDWTGTRTHADLLRFTRRCVAFRRAHPVLRRVRHPDGVTPEGWKLPPVSWHGERPGEPDWSDGSTLLAVLLHQEPPEGVRDTVFIAVNTGRADRAVEPPAPPSGTHWRLSLDTGAATEPEAPVPPGRVHGPATLRLAPHTAVALTAHPDGS
ncbi:glycogen debranching protein [Streptomyces rubradiris]|uniref:Glycogen operon protein GlgX homolog n=1 Tax=Streptomyces rubradiris TaxID=285531 RepID=A0ABQ3R881_STRRR|nr:isoamylase [Streptomyces rubradiris]GHH22865.1 glycogen operon protein GlgX homolog [Streptomyces rubradiris]GHI52061.1 glycogen operon protein GlgX homolog [Streptomyces rubradiris]